jgi:putative ubiquitin-RnfH superfamily antitoxin RatB of RatAB toxin-antitoxin module
MQVTLVWSWAAHQVREWTLEVPQGSTVAHVLSQVDWRTCGAIATTAELQTSIWGRPVAGTTPVQHLDRIEITRPLRVDPKVARRERFQRQGVRTAGLFARRRKP